ncbi:MAG: 16S rRNA (uracil(1498)-N(3))-methyltransferase [Nitrospiraceae bacterium]|nr:16S rRNA (uracil(1498)-N(3))-methyltransferase [Nitrospiraceae bacterium]
MRLYYPDLSPDCQIELTGEDFNYLKNVLRVNAGNRISLFDGKGNSAQAVITGVYSNRMTARTDGVSASVQTESPLKTALLQGMLKGQKMDIVIQKAVELGVSEIIPVITIRAEVRETRKIERWKKIAQEAARQCGRTVTPEISEPSALKDCIKNFSSGVIFWEGGGKSLNKAGIKRDNTKLAVAIGPEGGFTEDEVSLAKESGFCVCSLGPRILRAETAAIAALALVQYQFGDLG